MSGIRRAVQRSPLAALNGENSRARIQNVREDSSAAIQRIRELKVATRDQVHSYCAFLWVWHRLQPDRKHVSEISLREEKSRAKVPREHVDHVVSHKTWVTRFLPQAQTTRSSSTIWATWNFSRLTTTSMSHVTTWSFGRPRFGSSGTAPFSTTGDVSC